jgi:ATP-binding protein involved in chromosome partitioning
MTELTTEAVRTALRAVMDPELGDNIVDLHMVGDIRIADGEVTVEVALTIAGCPLRAAIERDVVARVSLIPDVTAVHVVISMMDADQKAAVMARARQVAKDRGSDTISQTTRILAIGSGKGGVGKSSVTTNLAVALANAGHTVGVLDADIWGFSIPRLLGMKGPVEARGGKMLPIEKACGAGMVKVLSMGFLADEDKAIMWRGLVLNRAVQQFVEDAAWGELDYLLVDLPPGTGDVAMGLVKVLPRAELLVVTTPPVAAQQVAHRAADMARRGYLPVAGVIENMSAFVCDHGTSYALFGSGGGERLAEQLGVKLLAQIPLHPDMAAGGDVGQPTAGGTGPLASVFAELARVVVDDIAPPIAMEGCSARMLEALDRAVGDVNDLRSPTSSPR